MSAWYCVQKELPVFHDFLQGFFAIDIDNVFKKKRKSVRRRGALTFEGGFFMVTLVIRAVFS